MTYAATSLRINFTTFYATRVLGGGGTLLVITRTRANALRRSAI